jgi:hypothetical protein
MFAHAARHDRHLPLNMSMAALLSAIGPMRSSAMEAGSPSMDICPHTAIKALRLPFADHCTNLQKPGDPIQPGSVSLSPRTLPSIADQSISFTD